MARSNKKTLSTRITDDNVVGIQSIMTERPQTSFCQVSRETGLSLGSCHTAVRKIMKLYPYKITRIHELRGPDFQARINFCTFFLGQFEAQEEQDMLFMSDECWFQLNGYVNSQNCRIWGREPPNEHVQVALYPQKVGVWAALSRQRVIGPIFFDGRLNAERYQNEILIPFID